MDFDANKYKTGLAGQQSAEDFLIKKGYEVLARNYRIKSGEIDLVTKDGEYTVFIEVKYRRNLGFGLPREAVGVVKQQRIIKTAMHYLMRHRLMDSDVRFDVVEVLEQQGQLYISHIENAFSV